MFIAIATVVVITCAMAGILLHIGGDLKCSWLRSKKSANANKRHIAIAAAAPPALLQPGWLYKYEFATADCSGKPFAVSEVEVANVCFISSNSSSSPLSYSHYCYNDSKGKPIDVHVWLSRSPLLWLGMVMATHFFKSVNCDPDTFDEEYLPSSNCEAPRLNPSGTMEQFHCTTNATVDLGDTYYLDST